MKPHRRPDAGVVGLMMTGLLLVLGLAAAWVGTRRLVTEQLGAQALSQQVQTRLLAEAALDWAQDTLAASAQPADSPWQLSTPTQCPAPLGSTGPQAWQCLVWTAPASLGQARVNLWRDVLSAPHVVHLSAEVRSDGQSGRARVRQSLYLPALGLAPAVAASGTVLNPCTGATPDAYAAWSRSLGSTTPEQIQQWSRAQEQMGLGAATRLRRNVYWVDQEADWTTPTQGEILLVFSAKACTRQCPRLLSAVQGTVVYLAGCRSSALPQQAGLPGQVTGLLVVEAASAPNGLPVRTSSTAPALFRAAWPGGIDPRSVQRIPGSWREGFE